MNEQDGDEMNRARMKALEHVLLKYMELYHLETATYRATEKEIKQRMEREIEKRAPGCGHITR